MRSSKTRGKLGLILTRALVSVKVVRKCDGVINRSCPDEMFPLQTAAVWQRLR